MFLKLATIIPGPAPGPPKSTRFTENQPGLPNIHQVYTENRPGLLKIRQVSQKSTRYFDNKSKNRNAADKNSKGRGAGESGARRQTKTATNEKKKEMVKKHTHTHTFIEQCMENTCLNKKWVKTLLSEEAPASQSGFGKGLR